MGSATPLLPNEWIKGSAIDYPNEKIKVDDQTTTTSGRLKRAYTDEASLAGDEITPPRSPKVSPQTSVLAALYTSSVSAKIWGVALRALHMVEPPTQYPEYTEPGGNRYLSSSLEFWTSGFFPGCLYLLYERQRKWPHMSIQVGGKSHLHPVKLRHACEWWTENLHSQAARKDTHDLGFMIQPWAQIGWELDKSNRCYQSLVTAAHSLASRYNAKVGCIRSWDTCLTKRYQFNNPEENFLVIIDNMMNIDLLYYVAQLSCNPELANIATSHATTTMKNHIRDNNSTCHVVDFDQKTGNMRSQFTNQGYSDTSCWTRGQAWGITGFAQAYHWTKNQEFLDTSRKLADYFIEHLPEDGIPYWDFDAPGTGLKDTSAALIAVYGMLLLHGFELELGLDTSIRQQDQSTDNLNQPSPPLQPVGRYLSAALHILKAVSNGCLAPPARFTISASTRHDDVYLGDGPESILLHSTINNYEFAPRRWSDHGLVYADYYFLLIGNKLLEMGIC